MTSKTIDIKHGILTRTSRLPVRDTMDVLAKGIKEKGATIYARIDQQAEAIKAGIGLPALEFLLFGNPLKGTLMMNKNPIVALDLPLKIICWQGENGLTHIAFNDQAYISRRYGLKASADSPLNLAPLIDQILAGTTV
ncbi:DUF302 domain-containing protein [Mucilaginibacter lutimaris]|uniref:DUF302 domain-containing protein n=1 Tax=Mucilaginibacter lutimaris TaxID=931629 RepID=A0ABW2ZEE4_9SPHI